MPFQIASKDVGVEIIDALSAEILGKDSRESVFPQARNNFWRLFVYMSDLDVIHDSYEPSTLTFFDHVFGFFSGVRQRGLQTTEEILRDGNFLTAVGELELDGDSLKLQASDIGPMFLTTATRSSLLRRFEQAKNGML